MLGYLSRMKIVSWHIRKIIHQAKNKTCGVFLLHLLIFPSNGCQAATRGQFSLQLLTLQCYRTKMWMWKYIIEYATFLSLKIWEMHCLNIFLHFCAFFFIWTVSISLHISMRTAQKSESGPEHHWAPEHLQVQPGMIGSKDGLNHNAPLVFDWL